MLTYKRRFEKLRLSVTKDCNFSCNYCTLYSNERTLSLSALEYLEIVQKINELSPLKSVRLTGGEPTLYKGLVSLIKGLKGLVPKVSLTTNAFNLSSLAKRLKEAGLDGINVSCDALDPSIFYSITNSRLLKKILEGVDVALDCGFDIKVNCTVLRGVNDGEILPLIDYFSSRGIKVRFLELMNMGHLYYSYEDYFFSKSEILSIVESSGSVVSLSRELSSTARYWKTADNKVFGIISNISHPFCSDCNRLRLDHRGYLYGCLSSDRGFYIADKLDDREFLEGVLSKALLDKQDDGFKGSKLAMQEIGG